MPVMIENLVNKPELLPLNSGKTLHLAPRAISSEIMDVDVNNNKKVQKLLDRNVIALHKTGKRAHSLTHAPIKEEKKKTQKEKTDTQS